MVVRMRKISIRFRLLFMFVSLLLLIFLSVLLTFNGLISNYIENNAKQLLSHSRMAIQAPRGERPPAKPTGSTEMVLITADYTLATPYPFMPNFREDDEQSTFLNTLKAQKASLTTTEIERIQNESGLYYYSVAGPDIQGHYVVFYINMTDLYKFERNLNHILMVVLALALLATLGITYWMATGITEPIRQLSSFAKRIGEGNYQLMTNDFKDSELDDLKSSMNETAIKLKEFDAEQHTFFQNASHELRTPLQIIKTNAEGIEHGVLETASAAALIRHETDRLGELVEDMIYLSRLESRSSDMICTENDLRETLSYTVERYNALFKSKGVRVQYDFDDNPVLFTYEERSLERAFQNLISNALRHTTDLITVTCKQLEQRMIISVADNGPGIKAADLPKIFDRFYKGENGVHGIGLSIVKAVVTHYGGRIEVTTSAKGSTFTIFFPVQ